ncbi:MAG: PAS domain-containing protein [Chromatiaceae bacterium]|nr:PAS domain-containing protein [Chromatiaceae bacterium]MCP5423228.1 PAS domain-containing protein [Chromatiaceae bacterium]
MNDPRSIRLQLWLPLFVALLMAAFSALILGAVYVDTENSMVDDSRAFLARDLALLQQEMSYRFSLADDGEAGNALVARGTDVNFETLVALDPYGRILHSTHLAQIGADAAAVSPLFDRRIFAELRQSPRAEILDLPDQDKLVAYYPLKLAPGDPAMRTSDSGGIFAVYDFGAAHRAIHDKTLRFGALLAALLVTAIGVLTTVLHRFVTRPAMLLERAARSISDGGEGLRCTLSGNGEFASIGRSFNQMAQQLEQRFEEKRLALDELQDHRQHLEQMVAERTAQLEQTNATLAMSRKSLADAQRMARLGSWVHDLRTDMIEASEELLRIFELDPRKTSVPFKLFATLLHPQDVDRVMSEYQRSRDLDASVEFECRLEMPDGRMKYLTQICEVGARNADGTALTIVGSSLDITQRKLDEILTFKAKEEAEAANEAKNAFMRNISHELRTPMHAISSYTDLCLKRVEGERNLGYLRNIKASGLRLTALLNDLLDVSALEQGRIYLGAMRHDLTDAARTAIAEARVIDVDKQLRFELDAPDSAWADVDLKLVGRVFAKLLWNSVRFSPEHATIDVGIGRDGDGAWHITVADRGKGISAEELDAVFSASPTLHETLSRTGGGGITLAVCRRFVDLHGGRIWATPTDPQTGVGTTIHFLLPAHAAEDPASLQSRLA